MKFLEPFKLGLSKLVDNLSSDNTFSFPEASITGTTDEGWSMDTVLGGVNSQAGEIVSPTKGMIVPAFFACVRNIAEDIGKLPVDEYRRVELNGRAGKEKITEGPIHRILRKQANKTITPMVFFQTLQQWAGSWGNGYAEIERNRRGDPVALHPIHPSRVRVLRSNQNTVRYIIHFTDGTMIEIPAEDIIHIRGIGDELVGWNLPVSLAKETLGSGAAQIMFASSFFGNSAIPSAVLEHSDSLSEKAQRRLRSQMRKAYGGARNAAKLLVLEEGMKYSTISMPLKHAQFLESRIFNVEEIARFYRMPLHKIQSMKQSTNNNIEQQATEYLQDTLLSWIVRWQEELNLKFYPNSNQRFVEFNVDFIMVADFDTRTEGYSRLWGIGALSQNEIRARENMNPIPGGDEYFVPLNMAPVSQVLADPERFNGSRDKQRQLQQPSDSNDEESSALNSEQISKHFENMLESAAKIRIQKEYKALSRICGKDVSDKDKDASIAGFHAGGFISQLAHSVLPVMEAFFTLKGKKITRAELLKDILVEADHYCRESLAICKAGYNPFENRASIRAEAFTSMLMVYEEDYDGS